MKQRRPPAPTAFCLGAAVLAALLAAGDHSALAGPPASGPAAQTSRHQRDAEQLVEQLESQPAHPLAPTWLLRLWEERAHLADPVWLEHHLRRLAAVPTLPPLLKSWCLWYLAAAELRAGAVDRAQARIAGLGFSDSGVSVF